MDSHPGTARLIPATAHVVSAKPTVLEVLRRFLPAFLAEKPTLSPQQRRAIWAITHCRTSTLGAQAFFCKPCGRVHLAYHSCNHKACPQCGHADTAAWIQRELAKRINAPYFLVTFTLPAELRGEFFGPQAKQAYELFFAAVSAALTEKLATDKGLRAPVNGFVAALHTWTQRLQIHLHIHCLVPGAGLNAKGRPVRVKQADFPGLLAHLQPSETHARLARGKSVASRSGGLDQAMGVDIQPAGSGAARPQNIWALMLGALPSTTLAWSASMAPRSLSSGKIAPITTASKHRSARG
jgi:hypothetical protein